MQHTAQSKGTKWFGLKSIEVVLQPWFYKCEQEYAIMPYAVSRQHPLNALTWPDLSK